MYGALILTLNIYYIILCYFNFCDPELIAEYRKKLDSRRNYWLQFISIVYFTG